MLRLLTIVLLVVINTATIALFVYTTHRYFFTGPDDLGGVGAIFAMVLGFIPVMHLAGKLSDSLFSSSPFSSSSRPLSHTQSGWWLLGLNGLWVAMVVTLTLLLPLRSEYCTRQGKQLYKQGLLNEAINTFDKAIYQNPNNAEAQHALALIYEELKDYSEARRYYSLAFRNHRTPIVVLNHYARLLIKSGEYDDALELLLRAETQILQRLGSDDESEKRIQAVVAKNLVWAYWKAGDPESARALLDDARQALRRAAALDEYPEIYCLQSILMDKSLAATALESCALGYADRRLESLDIALLRAAQKAVKTL